MFNSLSNFSAPKCWTRSWILPKANILSKFFTLKCRTRSCTLPTGNVECTRKSRPPQRFSDARLDARLFSLEKSDGNSVFAKNGDDIRAKSSHSASICFRRVQMKCSITKPYFFTPEKSTILPVAQCVQHDLQFCCSSCPNMQKSCLILRQLLCKNKLL